MPRQSLTGRVVAVGPLLGAVLVVLFLVLQVAVGQLRDAVRDAGRSDQVIAEAAATQRLAIDLETGLRGYLLTGDEQFRQPTRNAQRRIQAQGRRLRRLVAGDAAQEQRVDRLEQRLRAYASGYIEREIAAGPDRSRQALVTAAQQASRRSTRSAPTRTPSSPPSAAWRPAGRRTPTRPRVTTRSSG